MASLRLFPPRHGLCNQIEVGYAAGNVCAQDGVTNPNY